MKKYFKIIFLIIGAIILLSIFLIFWTDNKNLGNGYVYYSDKKMISSSNGLFGEIPSVVMSYDYDNNIIIAKQKPLENDPNALLYDFEYKYFKGYNTIYYWIIIKKENKVIGPMNEEDYIKQRNKYNVPAKLTLK